MVFLLDASQDVSREEFKAEKDLIKSLANNFNLSPYGPRGSTVIYAEGPRTLSRFSDPNMIERVERSRLLGTPRRLDRALESAATILTQSQQNTRKIAILLTAGRQSQRGKSIRTAAEPLRRLGAQTFVIALGPVPDVQEVSQAVDRPQDLFRVTNFSKIVSQAKPISVTIRDKPGMETRLKTEKYSFLFILFHIVSYTLKYIQTRTEGMTKIVCVHQLLNVMSTQKSLNVLNTQCYCFKIITCRSIAVVLKI